MNNSWGFGVISKVQSICMWALCQIELSVSAAKGAFEENFGLAETFSSFAPFGASRVNG